MDVETQSPTDVFGYFKYWQKLVDPVIATYFSSERVKQYADTDYGSEVMAEISNLTLRGGKRQRVAFVAAAFGLLHGKFDSEAIKGIAATAAGVEILQTQLLIHDDVIDQAPIRRSGTTIHELFRRKAVAKGYKYDGQRYGDSVGLLAGDLSAYFACYPIIESANISPEQKLRILDILLRSGIDTFYGQLLDLLRDARGSTDEAEILHLAFIKAGRSSGEAPMHIGAVLAGCDQEETLKKLSAYAVPVSIAAQLQDDILGVFGDENKLGKSVLSDLAQGKQTLLILYSRDHAKPNERDILDKLVGKKDITQQEAAVVKQIMADTGALNYVIEKAGDYAAEGQRVIEQEWEKDWHAEEKAFFWAVTEAAINREY